MDGRFTKMVISPLVVLALWVGSCLNVAAADQLDGLTYHNGTVSLALRNVELNNVMEMLSRAGRINVLLSGEANTEVSVNLYDVDIEEAIKSVAAAAGMAWEKRGDSYFIVAREDVGKYGSGGPTQLRTFKIQYSDPRAIQEILEKHLSSYGKITTLPARRLLVVEDTPGFLDRIATLLISLDRRPKQIFIEAKILEIDLRNIESFGLDWAKLFESDGGLGQVGVRGLTNSAAGSSTGLFFELVTPNVEVFLDALRSEGRLRTLATPKLLAMEDHEAEAIIGDRLGYNVTTTIDNVTTTSVEFLESGVILRVTPSVDQQNRILLDVHPEVSTGTVSDDGIPSQSTTEVTTTMLVDSGQAVFIGGLIRRTAEATREGVPVLGSLPLLGRLFSNRASNVITTELVVLITPYIIGESTPLDDGNLERIKAFDEAFERDSRKLPVF